MRAWARTLLVTGGYSLSLGPSHVSHVLFSDNHQLILNGNIKDHCYLKRLRFLWSQLGFGFSLSHTHTHKFIIMTFPPGCYFSSAYLIHVLLAQIGTLSSAPRFGSSSFPPLLLFPPTCNHSCNRENSQSYFLLLPSCLKTFCEIR